MYQVDIIMPTYNPDMGLLKRAVNSILNQSFTDWKLFLVQDGGENDISEQAIEINDSRIYLERISHRGKAATLNYALAKGAAPYIAYMDDDDIWYPTHLEDALACMKDFNARFVHTNAHEIFLKKEASGFVEIYRQDLNKGLITDKTLWYVSHINAVHTRELWELAGPYDENRDFFIDWDMFIRLAKHSRPHHCQAYTCEHYLYLDEKQGALNISGKHTRNPERSKIKHAEMFAKAFELLEPKDFAELCQEWISIRTDLDVRTKKSSTLTGSLIASLRRLIKNALTSSNR